MGTQTEKRSTASFLSSSFLSAPFLSKRFLSKRFLSTPALWVLLPVLVIATLGAANYLRPKAPDIDVLIESGYVPQLKPAKIKHFELINQRREMIDESVFIGQWSLAFFGFTHCPDFCPTTLSVLATLEQIMQVATPQLVLITVDPERDSTEHLGQYVAAFSPNILALTGEPQQIRKLADMLHTVYQRQSIPPGIETGIEHGNKPGEDAAIYQIDHSVNVALIDPEGNFAGHFSVPHRAREMSLALTQLMSL